MLDDLFKDAKEKKEKKIEEENKVIRDRNPFYNSIIADNPELKALEPPKE